MAPSAAATSIEDKSSLPPAKRRRVSSSAAPPIELSPRTIRINVSGAYIIDHVDNSPSPPSPASLDSEREDSNTLQSDDGGYEHDRRDIRLPNQQTVVSHVAADIGGSLAKVVYFSQEVGRREEQRRRSRRKRSPALTALANGGRDGVLDESAIREDDEDDDNCDDGEDVGGGRLHFLKFETDRIDACIEFMRDLQVKQRDGWAKAKEAGQKLDKEPELCVMATGGGAFKYYDRIKERLGVNVIREDEMTCLIQGKMICMLSALLFELIALSYREDAILSASTIDVPTLF